MGWDSYTPWKGVDIYFMWDRFEALGSQGRLRWQNWRFPSPTPWSSPSGVHVLFNALCLGVDKTWDLFLTSGKQQKLMGCTGLLEHDYISESLVLPKFLSVPVTGFEEASFHDACSHKLSIPWGALELDPFLSWENLVLAIKDSRSLVCYNWNSPSVNVCMNIYIYLYIYVWLYHLSIWLSI